MDAVASGGFARRTKRLQRTAKSCGPGAATLASIPAGLFWQGNGDNKRRSPGRARISRKAIARGKPECLGFTCIARVLRYSDARLLLRTGSAGAVGARLSLRPFFEEGQRDCRTRANHVARTRTHVSTSLRAKRSNPAFCAAKSKLDGFVAHAPRNDDLRDYLPIASAINPSVPTMTRHQANSTKP